MGNHDLWPSQCDMVKARELLVLLAVLAVLVGSPPNLSALLRQFLAGRWPGWSFFPEFAEFRQFFFGHKMESFVFGMILPFKPQRPVPWVPCQVGVCVVGMSWCT